MKKRTLPLLLAGMMTVGMLSGCGDSGSGDSGSQGGSQARRKSSPARRRSRLEMKAAIRL